jgi:hypothetical protein
MHHKTSALKSGNNGKNRKEIEQEKYRNDFRIPMKYEVAIK